MVEVCNTDYAGEISKFDLSSAPLHFVSLQVMAKAAVSLQVNYNLLTVNVSS